MAARAPSRRSWTCPSAPTRPILGGGAGVCDRVPVVLVYGDPPHRPHRVTVEDPGTGTGTAAAIGASGSAAGVPAAAAGAGPGGASWWCGRWPRGTDRRDRRPGRRRVAASCCPCWTRSTPARRRSARQASSGRSSPSAARPPPRRSRTRGEAEAGLLECPPRGGVGGDRVGRHLPPLGMAAEHDVGHNARIMAEPSRSPVPRLAHQVVDPAAVLDVDAEGCPRGGFLLLDGGGPALDPAMSRPPADAIHSVEQRCPGRTPARPRPRNVVALPPLTTPGSFSQACIRGRSSAARRRHAKPRSSVAGPSARYWRVSHDGRPARQEGMTTTHDDATVALARFATARQVLLTTYRRDGTPVGTPVHIAVDGPRAFVRTSSRRPARSPASAASAVPRSPPARCGARSGVSRWRSRSGSCRPARSTTGPAG